jgi:cyclopropane fatty-acyl-phospholipid synthase-like methyltransferase
VTDPRVQVVGDGYDAIADEYLEWTTRIEGDPKVRYLHRLSQLLPADARVLELGCGAGEPCTRLLAERFRVTGVDISAEQIDRACISVPNAEFIKADITSIEFEAGSFEGVAAFYVFNHVPRELLGDLFTRIHLWLAPGGLFLVSLGAHDMPDWTGDWLHTTMFFSGFPPAVNRVLLEGAGFELLLDELVTIVEPEPDGEAAFHWILARK